MKTNSILSKSKPYHRYPHHIYFIPSTDVCGLPTKDQE